MEALVAELGFTDPNGEAQTVTQRLRLWPAAVVAGLRVPGWAAARGQAGVTAVVLSTEGQPLQNRAAFAFWTAIFSSFPVLLFQ